MAEIEWPTHLVYDEWPQEMKDLYEKMMKEQGVDLGVPPPDGPAEPSIPLKPMIEEDFDALRAKLNIDARYKSLAAVHRARRSHMITKLKNRFETYTHFTAEEAAGRCKMRVEDMLAFLEFEVRVPGSLFGKQKNREGRDGYVITSPWRV